MKRGDLDRPTGPHLHLASAPSVGQLGHEGIPVVQAARDNVDLASSDLIGYMLNQRTGCMGPAGEDAEQEAEDFAALLIYRLGRLPSDRSSIVQVRLGEAFG